MKLFKKLFVFLTVLTLMLTVTACTIDESELGNLINGLTQSNSTVTTSSNLPVKPSTSTSNCYGVDSSEPYYPINPTDSTNSNIHLVPPSPPINNSSTTLSQSFFYNFSAYNDYYIKGDMITGPTKLNEHIILNESVTFQTSSGKTYKPEGIVFTGAWQLRKNGDYARKSMHVTIPSSGYLSLYVSSGSTAIQDGCISFTDMSNSSSYGEITFTDGYPSIQKVTVFLEKASTYALYENKLLCSINVWGVSFSTIPNAPVTENSSNSATPPVEILPEYSTSQESSSSQITVTPPTYKTNGLYSFESFYSYGLGYVFEENTNIEPFTIAQGIKITTSSGKTAIDGSQKGYVFTVGLQLGKNGSFDNKSLILTTTGYQQVEIYATRSSSGVISGELFVIDSLGYLVDSVTVTEQVYCNTITIPSSGTYALVATMESSITVWGVSFIENA